MADVTVAAPPSRELTTAPPVRTAVAAPAPARPAAPPRLSASRPVTNPGRHALGISLLLLGALLLGMVVFLYGLSGVQEARAQRVMYTQLSDELANEVAPLGPTTPGAPVARLDIPAIGVRDLVVVQGTSPANLTMGPGHLPDSVMPGQGGLSEIYGRRVTYGGPFARLGGIAPGDLITSWTQQGKATYRVAAVADSDRILKDPAPNRLLLLTAASPTIPGNYVQVDARLVSSAQPGPRVSPAISGDELPMAGDTGSLVLAMMWGLALAAVSAGGTLFAVRWSPWAAYLATAPLALAVVWNLYQSLSALLPNLY